MMNRIYLAGPYGRRDELSHYADRLEHFGYTITSTWLRSGEWEAREQVTRASSAVTDYYDLLLSDTLVCFTEPEGSGCSRGGRHVEFGVALAYGKKVVVVGPRENIFHCLPVVAWFDVVTDFLEAAKYGITFDSSPRLPSTPVPA